LVMLVIVLFVFVVIIVFPSRLLVCLMPLASAFLAWLPV